jgi:ADP-ribosylglycohydrolase
MGQATDQEERLARARCSLEGLSVGDAFGERFFIPPGMAVAQIEERILPAAPWPYTDDTQMALSLVSVLRQYGCSSKAQLLKIKRRRELARRAYNGCSKASVIEIIIWRASV